MRLSTLATFGVIGGLSIGAVIYGMSQLEERIGEVNKPLPAVSLEVSKPVTRQNPVPVDINAVAARERSLRDAQEQARLARYQAEANQAAYQAQDQAQQASYQTELQAQQMAAQQAAYQAQQAAYQAQHAAVQAQAARTASSNSTNQSAFGSGDATYHVVNGIRYKVPGR